jgi:hypothetical protein
MFITPDDVYVEKTCFFCGKKMSGIVKDLESTPRELIRRITGHQCANCATVVCQKCKSKHMGWNVWNGFTNATSPSCGKPFAPASGFLRLTRDEFNDEQGLSVEETNEERGEEEERLANAREGTFTCSTKESDVEIDGAHCFVWGHYLTTINFKEDGLGFSTLLFYRNAKAIAADGMLGSIPWLGGIATAAATQSIDLFINWFDMKACRIKKLNDDTKCYVLMFDNPSRERQEWIGLWFSEENREELQDSFLGHLRKHNVQVNDESKKVWMGWT